METYIEFKLEEIAFEWKYDKKSMAFCIGSSHSIVIAEKLLLYFEGS
jgi:hypothetical protein